MNRDSLVTSVRKKQYARLVCTQNVKNMDWISVNYHSLTAGDHALISEYGPVQLQRSSLEYVYNFVTKGQSQGL